MDVERGITGSQKCQTNWLESKTKRKRKRFEWLTDWLADWLTDCLMDRRTDERADGRTKYDGLWRWWPSWNVTEKRRLWLPTFDAQLQFGGSKNILARNLIWLPVSWACQWIWADKRMDATGRSFFDECNYATGCNANLCRASNCCCPAHSSKMHLALFAGRRPEETSAAIQFKYRLA